MLTPEGPRPIEQLREGELVLTRDEDDAEAPLVARVVERVYERTGRVLWLEARGQRIGTTPEHPFWAVGRRWTQAGALGRSDLLLGDDGQVVAVEGVEDSGCYAPVYNVQVADCHTYFVSGLGWGFSLWAHNFACDFRDAVNDLLRKAGKPLLTRDSAGTIWGMIKSGGANKKEMLNRLNRRIGEQKLGRPLTRQEQETLFQAGWKGDPKYDRAAQDTLFRRVANTKEARDAVKEQDSFKHASDSGREVGLPGDRKVYLEGKSQTTDKARNHVRKMRQIAAVELEAPGTVAVFMNRPLVEVLKWIRRQKDVPKRLREAIGDAIDKLNAIKVPETSKESILKDYPVKQPDVVRVGRLGKGNYKIDITEVVSPDSQTREGLLDRIGKAVELLPEELVGKVDAVLPK